MKGGASHVPTWNARSTSLAWASCVVWFAAATSTGYLGTWTAIAGAAVGLGVAVLLFDRPPPIALLRPTIGLVLLGALAGAAMVAATYLLYPPLARAAPFIATDTARLYVAFRSRSSVSAAAALVPVILGEELVWRGLVQTSLVRRFGVVRGIALAAVTYALAQAPLGSPVLAAVALACGLAWGALRAATGSLVPTLVAHLLWDALVLLWLPLDPR
jgi:membrane protease YdiL (CAAX protease family)